MMQAFGEKGYATTMEEVQSVLHDTLVTNKLAIV
jgi:hypothetical protein